MFAFVVCFSLSVLSQEIGWEERLWNDPFCVGWDVKSQLSQSTQLPFSWAIELQWPRA